MEIKTSEEILYCHENDYFRDKQWVSVEMIRDKLIKLRVMMDFDIVKSKQYLTNLIKELKGEQE